MNVVEWTDAASWDAFVEAAPDAAITHLWGWGEAVRAAYRHRSFSLAAVDDGQIVGVLPLTLVRSRFLGRHLVSVPYMDHAGVCGAREAGVEHALVDAARDLAGTHGAALALRYRHDARLDLACATEKVLMVLDLARGEDEVWSSLPSNRRGQIRKGQKFRLVASIHGQEGVPAFYEVLARNMRDLGSPVHSFAYFARIAEFLGDRARIVLVRSNDDVVGAGMLLLWRDTISVPWSSSLRSYFRQAPNQTLFWEAIRFAIGRGTKWFDFGRSSKCSGTYEAKREWGADPVQLYWYYDAERSGPPEEDVRRLAWGVRAWQRLPVAVANVLGPGIRKAIPN
jgi:FemAB-related protein (PEP-CTERM system-associated)